MKRMWYLSLLILRDIRFIYEDNLIEPYLSNGYHGLMQKARIFNDVPIVSIKGRDCKINFWNMRKDDAISIMNNSNLNKKWIVIIFVFHYI